LDLYSQASKGIIWSSLGRIILLSFEFIVGIILARLISPNDFGLIGLITFYKGISEILVNFGFSQALTRKEECTNEDYSTALST
jgi:teichuronic acid exporter